MDERDALAQALMKTMRELLLEHGSLLELAQRRKAAIAGADAAGLTACIGEEGAAIRRIAELDERRAALAARAVEMFGAPDDGRPTVTWIAVQLGPPHQEGLTKAAQALRDAIRELTRINAVVREAAESLATHVRGVIRAVEQKLSHSGAYGRNGFVEAGAAVVTAMDVTT